MGEPPASRRPSREHAVSFLGLLAVAVFFFRDAVLGGRVLFARDINMWWLPQVEAFVRCVASGSWPVWNPWRGVGQPFLADPSSAVFYPFTWLNLLFSPGTTYTLLVLLHLVGSAMGLYALTRRWGASASGAFVGASVWMLSPVLAVSSTSHLAGAAWMPWVVFLADRALTACTARALGVWSLAMALQIVAGSADMVAMTWIVVGLHAIVLHVDWRDPLGRANRAKAGAGVIAAALALGLSAAQWMPTLAIAKRSERFALSDHSRTTWSLHPAALLEIAVPFRWADLPLTPAAAEALIGLKEPWLTSVYLGTPALLLIAAACAGAPRRRTLFLLALGVGAVLVALGSHAPVYRFLVTLVPPLRILRFPMKAMVPGGLAWSCLVAFGWDVWRSGALAPRRTRWGFVIPGVACSVVAIAALYLGTAGLATWGASLLRVTDAAQLSPLGTRLLAAAALALAGLGAAIVHRRRPHAAAVALGVLTVAALVGFQDRYNPTAHRELFEHRPEVLNTVGRGARVYAYDYSVLLPEERGRGGPTASDRYRLARLPEGWTAAEGLVLGVHEYLNPPTAARWAIRGSYDPDLLGLYDEPLALLTRKLREPSLAPEELRRWMQVAGVTHVLALHDQPAWGGLEPEASVRGFFVEPIRVMRVPDPWPEASVASSRDIDASPSRVGSATVTLQQPDLLRVDVDAGQSGHAVWTQGFDPGWQATLDGQPAPVERAFVAFQSVAVPAGRHVVEWTYRPEGLRIGILCSLVSLAVALAAAFRRA